MFQEFSFKSQNNFSQNQRDFDTIELDNEKQPMFYGYHTQSLFDESPQLSDLKSSDEVDMCFNDYNPSKSDDSKLLVDSVNEVPYRSLPSLEQLMIDAESFNEDNLTTSKLLNIRSQLDRQYEQIKAFVTENKCLNDFEFDLFDSEVKLPMKNDFKIHSIQYEEKPEISAVNTLKTTSTFESEFKVPRRVNKNKRKNKKRVSFAAGTKPPVSPNSVAKSHKHLTPTKIVPSEYCFCKQDKMDAMIGCDHPNCKLEWFHYSCVGITKAPTEDEKWYCSNCTLNTENQCNSLLY